MSDWLKGNIARSDRALKSRQNTAAYGTAGSQFLANSINKAGEVFDPLIASNIKLKEEEKIFGPEGFRTEGQKVLNKQQSDLRQLDATHEGTIIAKADLDRWKSIHGDIPPYDVVNGKRRWKEDFIELIKGYRPSNRAKTPEYSNLNDYLYDQAGLYNAENVNFILRDEANKAYGYDTAYEEEVTNRLVESVMGNIKLRNEFGVKDREDAERRVKQWLNSAVWSDPRLTADQEALSPYGDMTLGEIMTTFKIRPQGSVSGQTQNIIDQFNAQMITAADKVKDPATRQKIIKKAEETRENLKESWKNEPHAQSILLTGMNEIYAEMFTNQAKTVETAEQLTAEQLKKMEENIAVNKSFIKENQLEDIVGGDLSLTTGGPVVGQEDWILKQSPYALRQILKQSLADFYNQKNGNQNFEAGTFMASIKKYVSRLARQERDIYSEIVRNNLRKAFLQYGQN